MHSIKFYFSYITLLETNYSLGGYSVPLRLILMASGPTMGGLCLSDDYLMYDFLVKKLNLPVYLESIYNLNVVDWCAYASIRNQ